MILRIDVINFNISLSIRHSSIKILSNMMCMLIKSNQINTHTHTKDLGGQKANVNGKINQPHNEFPSRKSQMERKPARTRISQKAEWLIVNPFPFMNIPTCHHLHTLTCGTLRVCTHRPDGNMSLFAPISIIKAKLREFCIHTTENKHT